MKTLYVSILDGDDAWTGANPDSNTSGTGPFKTIQRARDIAAATPLEYTKIIIREGTYTFTTPFILTSSNSGNTPFTPLTFKAYDDEIVKLCAATTLDSTLFSLVTSASDSAIYNRLNTSAKGKVYVYNLGSGINVGNFTTYWNGRWTNQADQLTNTYDEYLLSSKYIKGSDLPPLPEISIDGELLTLARWPSTGYAEMKSVIEAGSSAGSDCDCVGDATTTCVGKTPCYTATTDLCNYKYYTGTNSYLNNRIPKIPWGIDGIFEYNDADAAVIAKWPDPSTYEMYIYGPVSFDFSAEGMKILEINKTNRTIKVNSHRSKYGIIQFNEACYGRAYNTTGVNCTCKNSSNIETIPRSEGDLQPVYDSSTCLATSSYQESNDNLATRKLSSSPQRWRRDYWSDPHPRRWFALNILEELNSAGQYYIDRATNKLYVWSKTPITSSSKVLISKVSGYASDNKQTSYESDRLQSVIKITGASNIKFENIEICDTSGHGIDIIRSNNITLKNCNIYNTRKTGIRILGGTSNNVDGCNIFDTGTGGIRLSGGNKITLEPSKNIIQNCDITRTCLNVRGEAGVAAIQMHGVGNTIRKNKIYNLSTHAIGHSGNNNIIEYNNIHDVILECDDCGAIYTWANISNRGNICRYNLFRNIQNKLRAVPQFPSANANSCNSNPTSVDPNGDSNAMKDGWFGHCAIYFDNFAGGMTITGNIFYRCGNKNGKASMGAIFVNYGIDVIASNNIFVDCPLAVGSNPNRAYYTTDTTAVINDRQISTGGNESWEVALNDKPSQYNDSGSTPCCRTPTPGNFNGWSVLLNWNGITLGTANDVAFIQNPKLFEYNYKELGYITQCDIRSTVYTNQYPELLGTKSNTPTSFLYFDTTLQKLKVNANYPRKNYADRNVFVQTPYKTSTYSSWNQVIKTWDTTNDQVITKIEDAGFIDIVAGDFSLSPNSPILSNTLFDPIPVQYIAGYYEETVVANEVTVNIADLTINQDRQDFGYVDIRPNGSGRLFNTSLIKPESKYLKSHPKTKKLILCPMPWSAEGWDVNGDVVPYRSDHPEYTHEVRLSNYKTRLDLTKTVEGLLRAAAEEYNTYITNLNNDTVGGTQPVTEHMGEIPLITYDIEEPCYFGVLSDSNTRQWADNKYGAGTWQFCIDFLANVIPKSKELIADPAFRAANNIPEIFTKAKFSHYAMPHAIFGVSFCKPRTTSDAYDCNSPVAGNPNNPYVGWHEQEDTTKQQRRNMLISDEYFGKIMRTCDWFCPPVYNYWPDQDGTTENPANCSNGYVHRKNKYGRNWQEESHYQNVLIFKDFNSKEGVEKDIYPMLGHTYLGGSYFEQGCANLKFDSTNPSKLFWAWRKTTPEDVARIMELAIQAGNHSIKGFTYWSAHYGYDILQGLDARYCDNYYKYRTRAIYSRDIDPTKFPFILNDAYWQSKTCLTNTTTTNIFEVSVPATNTPYNNFVLSNLLSDSTQSDFTTTQVKRNSNTLSGFSSNPIDNRTSTQTQRQTDEQGDVIVPVTVSTALYKLTNDFHDQIDIYRTNTFSSSPAPTNGDCVTEADKLCSWANNTCWNNYCNGDCVCSNGDPTGCSAPQPANYCCVCKQFCIDNDFFIPDLYKNAEWPDAGKYFCESEDDFSETDFALCYECGVGSCVDYTSSSDAPLGEVIDGKFLPVFCSDLMSMVRPGQTATDLTDAGDLLTCIYNEADSKWENDYVLNVDNESIPGDCLIQGCYCGANRQVKPCDQTVAYVRNGITYYCPNTSGVTPMADCGENIPVCKPPNNVCCPCLEECGPRGDCTKYFDCVNNTGAYAPGGNCDHDVCPFTCGVNPCTTLPNCYNGAPTNSAQQLDCMNNCSCKACCVDPCASITTQSFWPITTIAKYDACKSSAYGSGTCCGSFDCSWCGSSGKGRCDNTDIRCTNPSSTGTDCCVCNNPDGNCFTNTAALFARCKSSCSAPTCCVDPCPADSSITTLAQYNTCIATYGSIGCLCGGMKCSYCGASPYCDTPSDTKCTNSASPNTDCCICNNTTCATDTIVDYNKCIGKDAAPTCADTSCCINPCIINGSSAISQITTVALYDQCIAKTGIFTGLKDNACCGAFQCSYCGATVCSSTDVRCKNTASPNSDCCICNNTNCATSTASEYITCLSSCASSACCTNPCIGAPTNYFDCIVTAPYSTNECCASTPTCADCGSSPCTSPHSFCSNSEDTGGCCACKNAVCATTTKSQYDVCRNTTNCTNASCCVNPCIGAPTNYFDCIVTAPYSTNECCSFSCFDCGSSPCTSIHTECNVGCCTCADPACSTTTKSQYDNCITNVNCTNASCCVNPCETMPIISTVEQWRQCKSAETGTSNVYKPYTDVGCSCGSFICSLCGSSACSNSDALCQATTCCTCNKTECATSTKVLYNACRLNPSCLAAGCCINPCAGAPKDWESCSRSLYAKMGCCHKPTGICDTCPYCADGCTTQALYDQCLSSYTCSTHNCCHPSFITIPPCETCPSDCNACNANATCVANGCCAGYTCSSITCPDSSTLSGFQNCISNGCCKNLGCCSNPCTGCSSDYRTCIKNAACNNAGCCSVCPGGVDGCCDLCSEDRLTCWKTCGVTGNAGCCPGGPCDGCLNPLDGSTWYSCITNPDCVELACCGTAPCILNECFSSTKAEYLACINRPACNPPIQDPLNPCCNNPCETCPTNYFDCIASSTCLLAGCCPAAPVCADCESNPCTSTHIECSNSEDTGGCCACKNAVCATATKTQYDICRNNTNCTNNSCCVNPCIGAPTNYFDCIESAYFAKGCCSFSCVDCGSSPCTSTHTECSSSEDTGGCCACKNAACATSNKTEYNNCVNNANCTNNSCCINPCIGAPTNYFDCIVSSYYNKGCCAAAPVCSDCINPCGHVDPRCSNATDHPTVKGCCRCKDARCADSTRSQYLNCTNKTNGSYCAGCCDNPCTGCGLYKTSEYNTCIAKPNCHAKGCCNSPSLDRCSGCSTNPNCSNDAICVSGNCCRKTPPCETCPIEYNACISNNTCRLNGCCPQNPCDSCNKLKTIEGYDECSADDVCMAYNCCNDPCESCKNMYYTECLTDVYCQEMNCCPPEPCPTCPEDYQQCISNEICRLYCCCNDV